VSVSTRITLRLRIMVTARMRVRRATDGADDVRDDG